MKALRQIGSLAFVLGLFVSLFAGMPWYLMVADDPFGHSSAQSEQDTRFYSRMGKMPTIEPTNAQEAKDLTKLAFDISEKYEIPVILRTTTMVSHSAGTVKLGKIRKPVTKGKFVKDLSRYYNIRPNLQRLHAQLNKKIDDIEKEYGEDLNKIEGAGSIGIIANGVSYRHVKEMG